MKTNVQRTAGSHSTLLQHYLATAQQLALTLLCGLLLTSGALAQEGRPEQPPPEQTSPPAAAATQKPPDPNEALTPGPLANQTVDGDIVFTSPGQFPYPRDIRLSDNFGGLRFYGADSLTTSPAGAAIQFFGNNASPFNGQLYLDSGALNSAALIFRTAPTNGTITERMRIRSDGNVGIGTTNPVERLHVVGRGGGSSAVIVEGGSGGTGVFSFSTENGTGVNGQSNTGLGVHGLSNGVGVHGQSNTGTGVSGRSNAGRGVWGQSEDTYGVYGISNRSSGVFGTSVTGYAGEFAGRVRIASIPLLPTSAQLCFTINGDLLQCGASSLRLKSDVQSYIGGLDIVRRLRPISFRWKESGLADIGLGAEEVAEVAPSFAFTNSKGEVTGVKYERLNLLLINAIKEQQAQIKGQQDQFKQQREQLKQQQEQIESLKKLVCLNHPDAEVCKAGGQ